jgi:hypothetical protein
MKTIRRQNSFAVSLCVASFVLMALATAESASRLQSPSSA